MTEEQVRKNIEKALAEAGKRNPEAIILVFLKDGENFYACICSNSSSECIRHNQTIFSSIVLGGFERKTVPREIDNKKIMSISYVSPFDLVETILCLGQPRKNANEETASPLNNFNNIFSHGADHFPMRGKSLRAG